MTSSVVAIFHRVRPQIASATLSSVVAAFRLSANPTVRRSLSSTPRYHDYIFHRHSLSSTLHDFFHRRSLSPPLAARRFRDFIFRCSSLSSTPSVDAAFRRLLASTISYSIVAAFRRLFTTSSAIAALHRLRPQVASATLSSVVVAFRRLLP